MKWLTRYVCSGVIGATLGMVASSGITDDRPVDVVSATLVLLAFFTFLLTVDWRKVS